MSAWVNARFLRPQSSPDLFCRSLCKNRLLFEIESKSGRLIPSQERWALVAMLSESSDPLLAVIISSPFVGSCWLESKQDHWLQARHAKQRTGKQAKILTWEAAWQVFLFCGPRVVVVSVVWWGSVLAARPASRSCMSSEKLVRFQSPGGSQTNVNHL